MKTISSWGRLQATPHRLCYLNNPDQLEANIVDQAQPGLVYGAGRSYGDVCLNPHGLLWLSEGLDHFVAFDPKTGCLRCEAGVLLASIQSLCIPQGWRLAVTPGTQMVSVGGAIANDIHGKNHHLYGSFGNHVRYIKLLRTDGEIIECSPHQNADWLAATIGGIGLTGVILEVELQLIAAHSPWLRTETIPFEHLGEFFHLSQTSESHWTYSVAWLDCSTRQAGKGLFMQAKPIQMPHPPPTRSTKRFPITPPFSLINRSSLRIFNFLYAQIQKRRSRQRIQSEIDFLYPLDHIKDWNRIYGPKGFYQYQSVIPLCHGQEATQAMLDCVARSTQGSFLTVLKTFGHLPSKGLMSFCQPGVTLALDFPNLDSQTQHLFQQLNHIVQQAGGRLYLAKDARMPPELFKQGYPNLDAFLKFKDPGISSALSKRLMEA